MSMRDTRPSLTTGNHIYLYRLLSEQLGCGKQTLLPRVEEALATDRMEAVDLGFESTRELLEQLDDFIKLTVFKGGRVYATVIAQPAWDEALAAPEKQQTDTSGKPWKRKKADKSLKPVKPRRIKRKVEEVGANAPAADAVAADAAVPDASAAPQTASDGSPDAAELSTEAGVPSTPSPAAEEHASEAQSDGEGSESTAAPMPEATGTEAVVDESADNVPTAPEDAGEDEQAPADAEAVQPAITLTVVYDPENANAGMRTLESTPGITSAAVDDSNEAAPERLDVIADAAEDAPVDQPSATEDAPTDEPAATTEPAPAAEPASATPPAKPAPAAAPAPEPALPDDAPCDFAYDVYCPAEVLAEMTYLLPYGADVLGIMTEYYHIARLRGTLEATRNRMAFPLGYTRDGQRHAVTIHLRRNTTNGGAAWIVTSAE
ncbi:hypothetical protein [Collinsella tanakaei]|uniref:hypothetical protein n=1 Tax=Collinsella tanakaei TaxID=626935 RepID=UPI0025A461B7|nr:hypothetical protein [Collinsella tanakaei]MDM8299876.1 hypothetical protein [Collinsella tanakaei]